MSSKNKKNVTKVNAVSYSSPPTANLAAHQPKRVVAYCRVSSTQEEQENSFEAQKKYYEMLLGHDPDKVLLKVYGDDGISGLTAKKRPEFQSMIEECRKGNVDEVYTKSVSRFARNYSECLEYARELKTLGVCIHFEKESFTTFDENIEMYFSLMAILAQEESNSISQSLNWAIEKRRKSGDPICSAAYGYSRDKKPSDGIHRWHIIEDDAMRIRMIFNYYLTGISIRKIAHKLTLYEKANASTKMWSATQIGHVLSNVAYIGDLHCGKNYTADYLSKKVRKNTGQRESYYIAEHHDAIISKDDFEKAQYIRKHRRIYKNASN